jgi:hypothetical protein
MDNVRRNHKRFEKTRAVRSEGSTVRLLDARARAGSMMNGACGSIRPRLDKEVLEAIDGLSLGRWRRPARDTQLGKMLLKRLGKDATNSTLVIAARRGNQQRVPG